MQRLVNVVKGKGVYAQMILTVLIERELVALKNVELKLWYLKGL
jgi:hypothetical protein